MKIIIEIPENGKVIIGEEEVDLLFNSDEEDDFDVNFDSEHGKLRHNGRYSHWN